MILWEVVVATAMVLVWPLQMEGQMCVKRVDTLAEPTVWKLHAVQVCRRDYVVVLCQ